MNILTVLTKLAELEREAGRLYGRLATLFRDDPKASGFFRKLSEDEQRHYDLVKYQERIVRKSPADFGEVDADLAAINRTLASIAAFSRATPSVAEAIRFSLDIETEIVESYAATVMKQSNQEFAEMVRGLTANFKEDHYQQLVRFAGEYSAQ